jgi:hypothetical protein
MEPVAGVLSSFNYDTCSYEEFINKEQDAPWNVAYIEGYWEGRELTDPELEKYRLEVKNMVGAIERFTTIFHDSNVTDKWVELRFTILTHATKLNDYWSEIIITIDLILIKICD